MKNLWKDTRFGWELIIDKFQRASIRSISATTEKGAPYVMQINGQRLRGEADTEYIAKEAVEVAFGCSLLDVRVALNSK